MIADFLLRLAIALPLVLLFAVGVLLAARRGWLPLPGTRGSPWTRPGRARPMATPPALDIVAQRSLSPALRLAVVRYRGEELLVGVAPQGFQLLGRQPIDRSAAEALPLADRGMLP
jgi:hypothetical protein